MNTTIRHQSVATSVPLRTHATQAIDSPKAPRTPWRMRRAAGLALGVVVGLLLGLACGSKANAQTVYRIVGPDGKVSFSDQPPADAKHVKPVGGAAGAEAATTRSALPFELQQVVGKYPVTLYSSNGCSPCDSGRNLLKARGIPYTEKSVITPEDVVAFGRISKESALPLLTIGGQQVRGYSETEWTQYLDAAGYPRQSILPASYRQGAATPLVPLKTAAESPALVNPADATAPAPQRRPVPVKPADTNPAGIRF
jgi:glutaredoxin